MGTEPEAAFAAEAERIIKPHDNVGPDRQARFAHHFDANAVSGDHREAFQPLLPKLHEPSAI